MSTAYLIATPCWRHPHAELMIIALSCQSTTPGNSAKEPSRQPHLILTQTLTVIAASTPPLLPLPCGMPPLCPDVPLLRLRVSPTALHTSLPDGRLMLVSPRRLCCPCNCVCPHSSCSPVHPALLHSAPSCRCRAAVQLLFIVFIALAGASVVLVVRGKGYIRVRGGPLGEELGPPWCDHDAQHSGWGRCQG